MLVLIYTATIFVSATLLFLVQPMFARLVLPLLGGSPAVWNTALVFFQAALLAGYAYAHFATRWLGVRRQAMLHAVVLLLPLLVLPIGLPSNWKPPTQSDPVSSLMLLMLQTVGLPFFVVSASSPLLQRWFAATRHRAAHDPYFLYAASNCGSMLALLAYPLFIEPNLRLKDQTRLWAGGYIVLVALAASCIALLWRNTRDETKETLHMSTHVEGSAPVAGWRRVRWVMLAFVPSSLMMSVTAYLSTDIAAIPLLWVIPLAIYLLTFILVFAARPLLPHTLIARLVPLVMLPLVIVVTRASQPIELLIPLHLGNFFLVTMMCHGELARDRPSTQRLTEFYLWMSLGGVLGGAFNALLAPLIFPTLVEYPLVLAISCLFLPFAIEKDGMRARVLDFVLPLGVGLLTWALIVGLQGKLEPGPLSTALLFGLPVLICFGFSRRPLRFALGVAAILCAGTYYLNGAGSVLFAERSFFGVHRVMMDRGGEYNLIVHGGIVHGMQSRDIKRQREPLVYYYRSSPVGQLFSALSGSRTPRKVAVVGLGAGSLAAYGQRGQDWTFYEIDPVVERIARDPNLFTYLRDARAATRVVLGDGRLSLQNAGDERYDLLILDAYSSDALPVHLMTQQALRVYLNRLAPRGLLAFNVSNLHLNLEPVLANLARDAGVPCLFQNDGVIDEREKALGKTASSWMVMARDGRDLAPIARDKRWRRARPNPKLALWTDDYSSLLSIFVWDENQGARD